MQIVDQNIVPVAGATVSASYWGPNQAVVSAGTNGNGKAILKTSYSFRPRGEW